MIRAFRVFACAAILAASLGVGFAAAQEGEGDQAIADTLFVARNHEPISYYTTYNRDLSSGVWTQALTYRHNARRVAFGFNGATVTNDGLRGITTRGVSADLGANVTFKATNRWLWALDGRGGVMTNEDDRSTTTRHQNRLQLRTQYSFNVTPRLSGVGILFGEVQQDQSLANRNIPGTAFLLVDSTSSPFDTTLLSTHARRDSSFTSGIRDGLTGSIRWAPANWLEVTGNGAATAIHSTTTTLLRETYSVNPGDPVRFMSGSDTTHDAPSGDQRFDIHTTYTGLKRSNIVLVVRNLNSDQKYFALNKGDQEHFQNTARGADFHFDTMAIGAVQATVDANLAHAFREYDLQSNLTSRVNTAAINTNLVYWKADARAGLGFQFGRSVSDRQVTQNGTVINRTLSALGARRMSQRLWLDGSASISLFARTYDDKISDRDDVKGSAIVGGGYRVSDRCSTSVHFSNARTHGVALDASVSGGNNVLTTYQMDAMLKLSVSRTFAILQNYMINANYQIYDYDEPRNTLTRIRRIDTALSESLFTFGFIRLDHNFFFQDRGSYTSAVEGGSRTYSVAQELYQQNLSVSLGVRPFEGIILSATQSLSNTRNFAGSGAETGNRNRWNLRLGGSVDRPLPAEMVLQGFVQHIGEYTETPANVPAADVIDYWIATVSLNKDF